MAHPTFILLTDPYGGTGLRARSAEAARARIDRLLDQCAVDAVLTRCELSLDEPCSEALVELINGGPIDGSAVSLGGDLEALAAQAMIQAAGHTLSPLAAAAWQRFGVPNGSGFRVLERNPHLGTAAAAPDDKVAASWRWHVEGEEEPARQRDAYFAFLAQHQRLQFGKYHVQVEMREHWEFRLRNPQSGAAAPPAYRCSTILATYCGQGSSAFLQLVFPYEAPCAEFAASWEAVCAALGMRLSPGLLRRVRVKADDGWVLRKIDFDGGPGESR